jgi:hypothetical protein
MRVAAALLVLTAASVALRTGALDAGYWIDEAIAVGIASHQPGEILSLLRQDGSPPLYYLLLHASISVGGTGEAATRSLSPAFTALAVRRARAGGRRPPGARMVGLPGRARLVAALPGRLLRPGAARAGAPGHVRRGSGGRRDAAGRPPVAKSNARAVAASVAAGVRPGDLVVRTQPEQVPVLHRYLPAGVSCLTPLGPPADRR